MIQRIMQLPQLDQLITAIDRLASLLPPVEVESTDIKSVAGRVLAQPLCADRDSPPLNVSAMDGYALRLEDLRVKRLPVQGIAAAGAPTVTLHPGTAVRIFTGAPVPVQADIVIKREDAVEEEAFVSFSLNHEVAMKGQNIRFQGENCRTGQVLMPSGTLLTAPRMASVSTFGSETLSTYRRVRVAILNTGDELVAPGKKVEPWQIRDSNGPVLETMLKQHSWIEVVERRSVGDELSDISTALRSQLDLADSILITGGVSMGARDNVPEAIRACGGQMVFHRLPIRPGKPILGAIGPAGQFIGGLPGNPVSVAVTARRFAMTFLRKLGGLDLETDPNSRLVTVIDPDNKKLDLIWYRLVKILSEGNVELCDSSGSGDLVSLSTSDGFIEIPAGQSGTGPWRLRCW
jgi:molybdopterin molybdotransferase